MMTNSIILNNRKTQSVLYRRTITGAQTLDKTIPSGWYKYLGPGRVPD